MGWNRPIAVGRFGSIAVLACESGCQILVDGDDPLDAGGLLPSLRWWSALAGKRGMAVVKTVYRVPAVLFSYGLCCCGAKAFQLDA